MLVSIISVCFPSDVSLFLDELIGHWSGLLPEELCNLYRRKIRMGKIFQHGRDLDKHSRFTTFVASVVW